MAGTGPDPSQYTVQYTVQYTLRRPVGSWVPPPPPELVQALAVARREEKFAIAVWQRGLAMRFAKFITPKALQALAVACANHGGEGRWDGGANG